jgi:hypothetical protein
VDVLGDEGGNVARHVLVSAQLGFGSTGVGPDALAPDCACHVRSDQENAVKKAFGASDGLWSAGAGTAEAGALGASARVQYTQDAESSIAATLLKVVERLVLELVTVLRQRKLL